MKRRFTERLAISIVSYAAVYLAYWFASGLIGGYTLSLVASMATNYPPLLLIPELVCSVVVGVLVGIPFGYLYKSGSFYGGIFITGLVVATYLVEFSGMISMLHIAGYALLVVLFGLFARVGEIIYWKFGS